MDLACNVTDVYQKKAIWFPICFHLICSSFSFHIINIIEWDRTREFRLIKLNAANRHKIAHVGNTIEDCFEDESCSCIIKTNANKVNI